MTASTPEQRHLAALIDGETGPGGFDAAIRAAEQDPDLRGRFERALIIGRTMRGEPMVPLARSVAERVSDRLASEPVSMRPRRNSTPRSINRPAAALALAASLIAVAVLVGPGLVSGPAPSAGAQPSFASTSDRPEALAMANVPAPGIVSQWAMEGPADSTSLDELLVDHRERASASGLTGFIPYAAVIGQNGLR